MEFTLSSFHIFLIAVPLLTAIICAGMKIWAKADSSENIAIAIAIGIAVMGIGSIGYSKHVSDEEKKAKIQKITESMNEPWKTLIPFLKKESNLDIRKAVITQYLNRDNVPKLSLKGFKLIVDIYCKGHDNEWEEWITEKLTPHLDVGELE